MAHHDVDSAAAEVGVAAHEVVPRLASACVEAGGFLYVSGHTSTLTGQAGADVDLESAVAAARESIVALLSAVLSVRGTLGDLDAVKLVGCVNAATGFRDHPIVINAASQILLDVFGPERGAHARSALGFSSLPGGAVVEIEAIFRIVD